MATISLCYGKQIGNACSLSNPFVELLPYTITNSWHFRKVTLTIWNVCLCVQTNHHFGLTKQQHTSSQISHYKTVIQNNYCLVMLGIVSNMVKVVSAIVWQITAIYPWLNLSSKLSTTITDLKILHQSSTSNFSSMNTLYN